MTSPAFAQGSKRFIKGACLALLVAAFTGSTAIGQQRFVLNSQAQLPTIGDPADRIFSPTQELKLGEDFLRSVYRSGAVLQEPEVSTYLQHLGGTLTASLGNNDYNYTFFVINDLAINAFAVPGGFIGVNAGLILAANNESELAGVVSHEIAHVAQRHIARRIADMSETQLPTLGAVLAGILLASNSDSSDAGQAMIYAGVAGQAQSMVNFTRQNEIEADRVGLQILYNAGFDPNGMADFFRIMQRQRFGRIPEEYRFLLTHPLDNVRISEAQGRIDKLPEQKHTSSLNFRLAKARLQAVTSNDPRKLVLNIEKNIQARAKPDVVELYAYSQALERNGEYSKAREQLEALIDKDPENITYQLAYARALHYDNKIKEAEKTLEKMFVIYPGNFSVNYYYALVLKEAGKAAEGRDLLKQYLRRNSAPTIDVYKLLAELHADSGSRINSQQALAEYHFGMGNYQAAIFQLKHALNDTDLDFVTRAQIEQRLREMLEKTES
ncbi:MAG TPA: M48 family metalloprotease [Gammaproteobacteria bacterium]